MTIGTRLGAGFALLLAALCGVSALGIASLTQVGAVADRVISEDWRRSYAALQLQDAARATFALALRSLQKTEPAAHFTLQQGVADARRRMDAAAQLLASLAATEAESAQLSGIDSERRAYHAGLAHVVELAETGKVTQGEAAVQQLRDPISPRSRIRSPVSSCAIATGYNRAAP